MALLKARELVAMTEQQHEDNRDRIEKALNKALKSLTLDLRQDLVKDMYVPGLKHDDGRYVVALMGEAGYACVKVDSRSDGRNGTDVHVSFRIPPQGS